MDLLKIVYIAGYSRSGSTILDILLSNHELIHGTGELCYLADDWLDGARRCTCGELYADCSFWSPLGAKMDMARAGSVIRAMECRDNFEKLRSDAVPESEKSEYVFFQGLIFGHILEKTGKVVIVDSSKTTRDMAGRALALKKFLGYDVKLIHLTKNCKATTKSYLDKGRNWALEGYVKNDFMQGLRSIVGWRLANEAAIAMRSLLEEENYHHLKYEDLVRDPSTCLMKLGQFLEMDLRDIIRKVDQGEVLHSAHHVGGNRLRLSGELKFKKSESREQVNLDIFHSLALKMIAGVLMKRLGYSK